MSMGFVTIDKEALLQGLKSEVRLEELNRLVAEFEGMETGQFPTQVGKIVAWAVREVEELVEDTREIGDTAQYGKAKHDAVVDLLEKAIKVPGPLELIDGKVISLAVGFIVGAMNGLFGKKWAGKVPKPEIAAPAASADAKE